MLKKSSLLEYLLADAEKLKNNNGKKALTANYFVISVLKILDAAESNQHAEEISSSEAKEELASVCRLFEKYNINRGEAIEAIENEIRATCSKSYVDEFVFGKINYTLEENARKRGMEIIDAPLLLELVLAEPSDAIKKHILDKASDENKSEDEDVSIDKLWDDIKPFLSDTDEAEKEPEEDEEKKSETPSESPMKAISLSDIVSSTRSIRDTLLSNIFGQDQAVNAFVAGYFQAQLMACSRTGNKKPQATFLFAGPPGVGKTFLAEKVAETLKLPYKRFDMSEYANEQATFEFCGTDKSYKACRPGNVTGFVSENPQCVLLFDEIEKAHINVIHLFLQILDAGHLRDNYDNEEVSFSDAVIILTTNVGKNLYDDPSIVNLSSLPRKKILKALASDIDTFKGVPLFPAAICSRFASGNVIMFNHLEANSLYTIAKKELDSNIKGIEESMGIKISVDDRVPSAIMFSEGGRADARTVKGRANAFFHEELYELFRLLGSDKSGDIVEGLKNINITVPLNGVCSDIHEMFENTSTPEVLVFADGDMASSCTEKLNGRVICHAAESVESARNILFNHNITVVLCDVSSGIKEENIDVLNAEDISSVGHDFLTYVLEKYSLPVYIIQDKDGDISQEEYLSFAKLGVREVLTLKSRGNAFAKSVVERCVIAHQQGNMLKLAKENKALLYKTSQTVSKNRSTANINLFDFRLSLITDTDDSKSILDSMSRPDIHFDDVIGAKDAKQELEYFVQYLRNPIEYMRKGVRSPRGVLLYGPPGTGKTLLAKAMAGESGVTFLKAEGNEFLKRYVGEGAEAVHSLFNTARKYAPSIVFVDEIDAIGKAREDSDITGDVLTAFFTEMDGFNTDTSKPVFVLAATNYDVDSRGGRRLDEALVRRFDRKIYIDLPNKEERKRYLEMKISKHPSVSLSQAQLDNIAMRSTGMSLADLESIFEMVLRSAIRSKTGVVGDAEFEDAFETFNSGEKKEWSQDDLERTARHEAGHALICWLSGEKPSYLTVVARGDHGGYMQHGDSEGKGSYTRKELLDSIRTALGGRASEIVYYGPEEGISTGASGDLYSATRTAERMICRFGMDKSVGLSYISSDEISKEIRDRINSLLEKELDAAIEIIEANKSAINAIVDALMEKNHLKEDEIDSIFTRTVVSTESN